MKKRNVIMLIICIVTAIILAVSFIRDTSKAPSIDANKNLFAGSSKDPLVGFWQEVSAENNYKIDNDGKIDILEFNKNGYLTEMELSISGELDTDSCEYSCQEESKTIILLSSWENKTYTYSIKNDILTFMGDTYKRINNADFLEKEQEKRETLKNEYEEYCKKPINVPELIGKWSREEAASIWGNGAYYELGTSKNQNKNQKTRKHPNNIEMPRSY